MLRRYRVGGTLVESEFALSLPASSVEGDAEITVELGSASAGTVVEGQGVGLAWLTTAGSRTRVRVETESDASSDAVRGFVQGVVLPAALQRTGAWHLHASSVAIDGEVVALVGTPGTGKSLLAVALARQGCAFYGDDALVISGADAPRAILGSPNVRLGDDAAAAMGVELNGAGRCPTSGKRILSPVSIGFAVDQREVPLRAIYLLSREGTADARLADTKPSRAAVELLAAEFHPTPDSRPADEERTRFETAVSLARQVPMRSIVVPDDISRLPDVAAVLIDDVRSHFP